MPVLNSEEFICMVTGSGPTHIMDRAKKKLNNFQKKLTDRKHLAKVNAYTDEAEDFANEVAGDDKATWDRMFHLKMNELTRAAGLRV